MGPERIRQTPGEIGGDVFSHPGAWWPLTWGSGWDLGPPGAASGKCSGPPQGGSTSQLAHLGWFKPLSRLPRSKHAIESPQ